MEDVSFVADSMAEREHDANLGHPFVQAINRFDSSRIRKGKHIRAKPHDVSVLPMEGKMRSLRVSSGDIIEAPPVAVAGEAMSWVSIQAFIELVM